MCVWVCVFLAIFFFPMEKRGCGAVPFPGGEGGGGEGEGRYKRIPGFLLTSWEMKRKGVGCIGAGEDTLS